MANKKFENIIGKEKGKTGFVLGLGPSLNKSLPMIKSIGKQKETYAIISCNNMDVMSDINYDYWILAQPADNDSPYCVTNLYERINKKGAFFLYTDCLDLTDRNWVAEHIKVDYIGYDQRHFKSEPCGWGKLPGGRHICCAGIISGRKCIQEILADVTGHGELYGAGDTVGVHMVALSVILGLNPVYVTGIDLDYSKGYFNNKVNFEQDRMALGMANMNYVPDYIQRVKKDIGIIRDAAEKIGTKIYSLNETGHLSEVLEYSKPNL